MALVMLPCDLPWWGQVQKHLNKLLNTKNTLDLIEGMQKIYELCNISLDPEEDTADPEVFNGFRDFLDNEMSSDERSNFFKTTLPSIVRRALSMKQWKPKGGLHFSLQQQPDSTELEYNFVSSLIANAFFSTFPKRTDRSHPTLQNFNFTHFFKYLKTCNFQRAKLRSILHYFDWLEVDDNSTGFLKISRQVMSSKEWLTIEDWLECSLPLCPVQIKHEGRMERAEEDALQVCFSSTKIGGRVLSNGNSQECINLSTFPEMLTVLLNVEALEDNEVLTVENARRVSRISDPKNKATIEKLETTQKIALCCIDAEDFTTLPIGQFEEDNILRELNKCLLAYQQKQAKTKETSPPFNIQAKQRRLSPIGESVSSTEPEMAHIPMITQNSCSTNRSGSCSPLLANNNNLLTDKLKDQLERERNLQVRHSQSSGSVGNMFNNRRGKFIVLGSSGEVLPVTRRPLQKNSSSSISESSDDEFHSARTSLDDGSEDEDYHRRYSNDLGTPERRSSFAQRLRDALRREESDESGSSDSYAVGISVAGSGVTDPAIKLRRGGSTGFMLKEDSLDEEFLKSSWSKEKQWLDKFRSKHPPLSKKDSNKSSEFSFSTDYSSEMEEVYEQFSRWLEDPILETDKGTKRKLEGRDLAVVQFAGSLLKRTLSESFAGVPVPLTEECEAALRDKSPASKKDKLVLNAKSLSLELARHKHRLAAQLSEKGGKMVERRDCPSVLSDKEITPSEVTKSDNAAVHKKRKRLLVRYVTTVVQTLEDICVHVAKPKLSQIAQRPPSGLRPISTGNWGCGSSRAGDVQLKVIIQWLAASVAGAPTLTYYTAGHKELAKLDTVCRILVDRKWNVKDLTQAALRYSSRIIRGKEVELTLFEDIIGG